MKINYKAKELKEASIKMLSERGVSLDSIGEIVVEIQKEYIPTISVEEAVKSIERVLEKREVNHAILTGIALDVMAEQNLLPKPIQDIIECDEALYGIDEILPLSILNIYGSIAFTNFGYLDKLKIGIIKSLDNDENKVNTFLDDIVAAIAASAASRIAHSNDKVD